MSNKVQLTSSDGRIFKVSRKVAMCFGTIRQLLELLDDDGVSNEAIPLPKVNAQILEKLLQWAEFHEADWTCKEEKVVPTTKNETDWETVSEYTDLSDCTTNADFASDWNDEYFNVDQGTLYEMMMAADYMDIPKLTTIIAKKIANMIKGKTVNEIREFFNVKAEPSAGPSSSKNE